MEHPYTFFGSFFHVGHETMHVVTAVSVSTLVALASVAVFPQVRVAANNVLPDRNFSLRTAFDLFVEMMAGLCEDIIGHGSRKYLPFVGSVFLFILFGNLIGLVPGFLPPTENWATGAAVAAIVFIAFNYFGFREHGLKYLGHFLAPLSMKGVKKIMAILLILPILAFQMLFGTIEVISMAIRPITLSIRLFVNIMADHTVGSIFSGLAPFLVPIPFLVLGLLVSVLQALIFALLTIVYISLAVAHEH